MLWRKFVTWKSDVKVRWQTKIIALLMIGILLCGFTWGWTVEFVASVLFPVEDAIDFEMVLDFPNLVDADDLSFYLNDVTMAQQISDGILSNLSTNVYSDIEIPDMTL